MNSIYGIFNSQIIISLLRSLFSAFYPSTYHNLAPPEHTGKSNKTLEFNPVWREIMLITNILLIYKAL